MRLTILAATGGIGGQVLEQAVAAGHDVTAVVRKPSRLPDLPVRVVVNRSRGSGGSRRTLQMGRYAEQPTRSCRVSGHGRWLRRVVASRAPEGVVQAMRATGVRRIVVVSAASVGTVPSPGRPNPPRHNPGDGFLHAARRRSAGQSRISQALRGLGADGGSASGQRPSIGPSCARPGSSTGA